MSEKIKVGDVVEFIGFDHIGPMPSFAEFGIKKGSVSEVTGIQFPPLHGLPGRFLVTTDHPFDIKVFGMVPYKTVAATHESCYRKLPPAEPAKNQTFNLVDLGIRTTDPVEA